MAHALNWFEIPVTDMTRSGRTIDSEGKRVGLHALA